jgi:hypothetical protein
VRQIDSLDSWKVFGLIYYGQRVVMASYDFPDKKSGALRRGMNSMAENFSGYNFEIVDRYLVHVPHAAQSGSSILGGHRRVPR